MTLIPAARLSRADMLRLGNNVLPEVQLDGREQDDLDAAGRFLAACGHAAGAPSRLGAGRSPGAIDGAAGWVC